MIVRALGMPEAKGEVPAFQDVSAGDWYSAVVAQAGQYELLQGMRTAVSGRLKASRAKRRWRSWVESWSWQD